LLQQEPYKGAEMDSRAKFGKETVAGAHRRPKWVPHYGAQADSGRAQDGSGSVQACSPPAQVCSPSAQVKAAVAHVRRLKRNQRKKKLTLSLWVFFMTYFVSCGWLRHIDVCFAGYFNHRNKYGHWRICKSGKSCLWKRTWLHVHT